MKLQMQRMYIGIVCVLALGVGSARPVMAEPVRLAVIAEGASADCRNLADLLQAELSNRDGIEMVEREEIDRVLAEQALTASGLVAESARVNLGALLKAKGLLFVDQMIPTNGVFQLRLVETAQGYVAGFMVHRTKTPLTHTLASIDRALTNLSLPAEQRIGVSVLVINNGLPGDLVAHPIVQTFMAEIEERMLVELAAIPGAWVLERRKLGDVAREEDWAGGVRALVAGTLVVDGGLNLGSDLTTDKHDPQVVLALRLRNLATGAEKVVKVDGGLLSLRSIEQKALADLFEVAMAMQAETGSGMLKAETKILDDLVRGYALPWAGEAAVALDKSDRKRVEAYIRTRAGQYDSVPDDRAKAIALAQVETLCREHGISLMSALRCEWDSTVLQYLKRVETFHDPELKRLLRPLRTALLVELDRWVLQHRNPFAFDRVVKWLPGVVPLPSERKKRLLAWHDTLQADPATSDSMRYFLSTYLLYVVRWGTADLMRFRNSADPVCRFHANRALLRRARTRQEQIEYSNAMMEDVDAFLARTKGVSFEWHFLHTASGIAKSGQEYAPNRWPSESLRDLYCFRPEWKGEVQRKFFERMKGLLDEKDFGAIDFLQCDKMLTTIPDREVFDWMNQVIDQGKKAPRTGRFMMERFILDLERWRAQILVRHPEFHKPDRLKERVLLSVQADGARWRTLTPPQANADRCESIAPYQIIVDGDTLWVGIEGSPVGVRRQKLQHWYLLLGVLEIDLASLAVKSERARWFLVGSGSSVRSHSLAGMIRIGNHLAMHHPNVGIVAIPVQDRDMEGCRRLGPDEGLPVDASAGWDGYCGSLVGMPRGVCLGLRQWIVYWDFDTWQSRILLDVESPAADLGYPDRGKYVMSLQSDPLTEDLWLELAVISRINKTSRSVSTESTSTRYHAKGLSGGWKEIQNEAWAPRSEDGQKIGRARQLLKDSMVTDIRDVTLWRDNIIVLYGPDDDNMKLSIFSSVDEGGGSEQ